MPQIAFALALLCSVVGAMTRAAEQDHVRVLSFNLFVGGEALGRPLADSAAVIRAADADVAGLQETRARDDKGEATIDNGPKLAALLGARWTYLPQTGRRGILTRLAVVRPSRDRHGVLLRDATGREIWLFNVHLPAAPYQPYMLVGIEYGPDVPFIKTAEEAIRSARAARGKQVDELLADIRAEADAAAGAAAGARPVVVTGDFNEPSHEDWTDAAAKAGRCPIPVAFPSVKALIDVGFRDAYRAVHPDPLARPGYTWTPTTSPDDPKDRHDRIDFVLARGPADIVNAMLLGEDASAADLVVTPWPSDHRAVLAALRQRQP